MNKLEERFGESGKKAGVLKNRFLYLIQDLKLADTDGYDCLDKPSAAVFCAKEAKDIAIEFVKTVLESKITVQRQGRIASNESVAEEDSSEKYWPKEFQLMLGQMMKSGDEIFNEFIEEKYYTSDEK